MPFSEFQNGNAGLALPQFQSQSIAQSNQQAMQSVELGASLMDRAQRRELLQSENLRKTEEHTAQLITTGLDQDARRADIALKKITLKETERTATKLAEVREKFSVAQPNIEKSLDYISKVVDPYEQQRLMSQLQNQSAVFNSDPQITRQLDSQFSAVQKLIDKNTDSKLGEEIMNRRAVTTEAEAERRYPGQELRVISRPSPNQPGVVNTFYVPTGKADPQLEGEAFSLLRIAQATGDVAKIEDVLKDPSVMKVMRVPNSNFSKEYLSAVTSTIAIAEKREEAKRKKEDQIFQRTDFNNKQTALTVPGFSGQARTEAVATKVAEESASAEVSIGLIDELESISDAISKNPSKIADPEFQGRAEVLAKMIQSTNRLSIVGPGAVTQAEWAILEKFAANPTDASTLIPFFRSRAKAGYKATREVLFSKLATSARSNFLEVDPKYFSKESISSRRGASNPRSAEATDKVETVIRGGKSYRVIYGKDGKSYLRGEDGRTYRNSEK
jgi:hypothetical protein